MANGGESETDRAARHILEAPVYTKALAAIRNFIHLHGGNSRDFMHVNNLESLYAKARLIAGDHKQHRGK